MWSECSVETIWDVMEQLYSGDRTQINMLGVKDDKLCPVLQGCIELNHNIAVIFVTSTNRLVAATWDEYWLANATMRAPSLTQLLAKIKLQDMQKEEQ